MFLIGVTVSDFLRPLLDRAGVKGGTIVLLEHTNISAIILRGPPPNL